MKVRLRSDGAERVCAGLCSRSRPGRHIIAAGRHRGLGAAGRHRGLGAIGQHRGVGAIGRHRGLGTVGQHRGLGTIDTWRLINDVQAAGEEAGQRRNFRVEEVFL